MDTDERRLSKTNMNLRNARLFVSVYICVYLWFNCVCQV